MSRISALWTAGVVAVLFALVIGAVMLRPILSVDAGDPAVTNPPGVVTGSQGQPAFDFDEYDDDDEWENHEDEDDHESDDSHEDDD